MTEDEAKTKWCPFVRYGEKASNRGVPAENESYVRCIGSACMAWKTTGYDQWYLGKKMPPDRRVFGVGAPDLIEKPIGHCGLANH